MSTVSIEPAPFFIVSSPRSGSTLLRLLLTAHPDICIPPESKFLVRLFPEFGTLPAIERPVIPSFLDKLYADRKFGDWKISRESLDQKLAGAAPLTYAGAIDLIYRVYRDNTWPKARLWGDKNPGYRTAIGVLLEVFPKARIVHILRDVRAVYLSMKNVSASKRRVALGKITRATRKWRAAIRETKTFEPTGQCLTLRYEDLVARPEPTLTSVCKFIGIEFDPRMLEFHRFNEEKQLVPAARAGKHANTFRPLSQERIDAWKTDLTHAEIQALEFRNRGFLEEFGYELTCPGLRPRTAVRLGVDIAHEIVAPVWALVRRRRGEDESE